jgi:hypothetical protein
MHTFPPISLTTSLCATAPQHEEFRAIEARLAEDLEKSILVSVEAAETAIRTAEAEAVYSAEGTLHEQQTATEIKSEQQEAVFMASFIPRSLAEVTPTAIGPHGPPFHLL